MAGGVISVIHNIHSVRKISLRKGKGEGDIKKNSSNTGNFIKRYPFMTL